MDNILDGFVERLYVQVIEALQTAANLCTCSNISGAAGISAAELDPVIRIVAAYGAPVIFGFQTVVSKFNNSTLVIGTYSPNVPLSDLDEVFAKRIWNL